jgi:hypothetical protein
MSFRGFGLPWSASYGGVDRTRPTSRLRRMARCRTARGRRQRSSRPCRRRAGPSDPNAVPGERDGDDQARPAPLGAFVRDLRDVSAMCVGADERMNAGVRVVIELLG